jgi:hypothetical protein
VTKLKKSVRQLVEEAEAEISTLSTDEVQILLDSEEGTLFDIRDVRELWREGTIPGAVHTPRGMLEFWADPDHREIFASGKQLVFLLCFSLAFRTCNQSVAGHGRTQCCSYGRRILKVERTKSPDKSCGKKIDAVNRHPRHSVPGLLGLSLIPHIVH